MLRPVTQPPLNVKPKLNFSTHPSAKQLSPGLAPGRPVTLAGQRNYGSESNLLDSLSLSAEHDATVSRDSGNWSRTGMRPAGSVPDLLSPHHVRFQGEEPPPLPPERPLASAEKSGTSDAQPGYYDTPAGTDADAFYNTPPVKHLQDAGAGDFYNVPPTVHPTNDSCYDVPPTDEIDKRRKHQSETEECNATGGSVYNIPPAQNAPAGGRKKERKDRVAGKTVSLDDRKSGSQTYDIPPLEQHSKLQSLNALLLASTTNETYDTPGHIEIKDNIRPSAVLSDQTYDTPPTSSEPLFTSPPNKPHRGKPRLSLEQSETVQHSERFSGQETYDVPSAALHSSSAVKTSSTVQSQWQSTGEMYDVPPLKSAAGRMSNRISLSGAADLGGLGRPGTAEEQTYNVPASCVPPVPAKNKQAPPPKPPRPTVQLPARNVVSAADTSVSSVQKSDKISYDTGILENEHLEKDTVAELPSAAGRGTLNHCRFLIVELCYDFEERPWDLWMCFRYAVCQYHSQTVGWKDPLMIAFNYHFRRQ